jgi:CHAT domain-containing protein
LFDELDDLLVLAEVADRSGRSRDRATLLVEARALADSLGTRSGRTAVALTSARLADRAGDAERVLAALRDVDSTAFPADFAAMAEMHALAARAYARRGLLDSAVAMGGRAIASVERVRADLTSEPLRRALLADRSTVYAEQVITLLRLHRDAEAFSVADGARSRGLVDFLASARRDLPGRSTPGGLDEGERLLRQIDVLLAKLKSIDSVPARERGPAAATMSADLMARLEKARGDYEAFLARAVRDEPTAAALLGVRRTSLDQVQQALEPDEALLEYLVAPDRIVIFVATSRDLRSFQMPGASGALTDRVRLLRELWGSRDSDWHHGLPAARALDSVLIGPIERAGMLKGVRRLVVVPHGVLSQLPFAALVDPRSGRFVAQDFEVLYLPSGGTLPALRRSGERRSVALGGVAFAPFPRELPASAGEVAAVQRAVSGLSTSVGQSATEEAVRNALRSQGIVHVASHGTLNSRNPMFARVELAAVPQGSSANDGRLEVHELLGTSVRSHLVFLSGCETSVAQSWLDDAVRGTDYTTLAQALLYAGAENVIGTLWRVDDAGAAQFAETFYAPLTRLGLTSALASAQRTMIASPKFAHPYYWAGYILTGAGRFGG